MSGFYIPQGWNFSPMISSLVHGDSLNILFNQLWEKQSIFPMNCCYPSIDNFSCSLFPVQSTGYEHLLLPQVAINQCQQNWQNGGGFWGGANTSGTSTTPFWNNGQMQWPWQNSESNSGGSSTGKTQADNDLSKLKDIYEKLNKASLDGGNFLSDSLREKYKEAMKLKTAQEKVDALMKIIAKIDAERIQEVIYQDTEIKTALVNLGFNLPKTKAFEKENNDEICKVSAKKIKDAIEQKNVSEIEEKLCSTFAGDSARILAYVSAWNKENPNKPLIKEVAKLLPDESEEQGKVVGPVVKVCNALISKADKYSSSYRAVDQKVKALNKALAVINEAQTNKETVTEDDLIKVSKAFDKLYAVLRMTEAAEVDKKIQEKYKILGDIKASAVADDLITSQTRRSLERELGAGNVPNPDVADDDDDVVNNPTTRSDVADDADDVEDADDEDNEATTSQNSKLSATQMGNEVYNIIHGCTDDLDYPIVDKYISPKYLNKDNIIEFLTAFYSHNSHEGIIEYLDDEHDGGQITMQNKKNIIKSLIEKAKKEGLKDDPRVKKLEQILELYKSGDYKDYKTFNHGGSWCDFSHGFWNGMASIIGDTTTHNEIIDDQMKSLWKELRNK